MLGQSLFIWNVRGLNSQARRDVVRQFFVQERLSIVCLVETKIDVLRPLMVSDLMGTTFDYVCLPAAGASGGIIVAWRRDVWSSSGHDCRRFSVTVRLQQTSSSIQPWSLSTVYGPVDDRLKPEFLDELKEVHAACPGPLLI